MARQFSAVVPKRHDAIDPEDNLPTQVQRVSQHYGVPFPKHFDSKPGLQREKIEETPRPAS